MSQPIRGQGGHLIFPIGPKNTNSVEGVEILLPIKFCWIPFSGFREEVENMKVYKGQTDDGQCMITIVHLSLRLRCTKNVSANQRPGQPTLLKDQPETHKLGRDRWVLASVKFRQNLFHGCSREGQNILENQRQGWPSLLRNQPVKSVPLYRTRSPWFFVSFFKFLSVVAAVEEENLRMAQPMRGQDTIFVDILARKKENLVEYLLPVKFHQSVKWLQWRSRKCVSQSEACTAIFFDRSARKKNLVKDIEYLLPVKFCFINPFSSFWEEVEMWEFKTTIVDDDRQMTDEVLWQKLVLALAIFFSLVPLPGTG